MSHAFWLTSSDCRKQRSRPRQMTLPTLSASDARCTAGCPRTDAAFSRDSQQLIAFDGSVWSIAMCTPGTGGPVGGGTKLFSQRGVGFLYDSYNVLLVAFFEKFT